MENWRRGSLVQKVHVRSVNWYVMFVDCQLNDRLLGAVLS